MVPPLETLPPLPGDRSGGAVYLRIVLSPEEASRLVGITEHWFSLGGVVSTSPKPQAGGPPLVGCPRLLNQFIRSYPPYRRPFLHPQPEDAPCRGDRDPLITWAIRITYNKSVCVCIALGIQQAMRMLHPVICNLSGSTIFSTLSHQWRDF